MNKEALMEDLANIERQYMELYGALTEYQRVFTWLNQQEWYQDNQHFVKDFMRLNEKDLNLVREVTKLGTPVPCSMCQQETVIRQQPSRRAVCIQCKAERKRRYALTQIRDDRKEKH
jgi:hypothetical protein